MSAAGDIEALLEGVRGRRRAALGRALTLVESRRPQDRAVALRLLERLGAPNRQAMRLGVTGVPGAGKSTLLDALGSRLTEAGHSVGVLAVDPSSQRTGGSILGDKTRMARLARSERAFVRPQPSGGVLGGLGRRSAEALALLEAAGFEILFVETVGVGQSEGAVAELTDLTLLVLLAGAGDELQGIKRGVLELADVVVVNKADGEGRARAETAARQLTGALRLLRGREAPPVLTCSARQGDGLDELWTTLRERWDAMRQDGRLQARRRGQRTHWLWRALEERLLEALREDARVRADLARLAPRVEAGELLPTVAAERLVARFLGATEPADPTA